jgi:hypothetical protein
MRITGSAVYALAGMFAVFAVWAVFGFSFPGGLLPKTLNIISKILCFITAIMLFVWHESEFTTATTSASRNKYGAVRVSARTRGGLILRPANPQTYRPPLSGLSDRALAIDRRCDLQSQGRLRGHQYAFRTLARRRLNCAGKRPFGLLFRSGLSTRA